MWAYIILVFVARVEASNKKIVPWKPLPADYKFTDCAGMGCRWFYPHYDFGAVTAGNKVPWNDRFKNQMNDDPEITTPKGLKQKEWEAAIIKFWPENGAKQNILQVDKPGKTLSPEKSAISLAAIQNIWNTLQYILETAVEGGKYKNTRSKKKRGINELNMADINQMFVKPMLRGLQISMATAIQDYKFDNTGKINPSGASAAGHIQHFISHDWAAPFSNFVTTAWAHCEAVNGGTCDPSKNYYWVCTFANKQFGFTVGTKEESPFYIALTANPAPKSVLAIQHEGKTETDSNLSIGRIWCAFEMHLVADLIKKGKISHWSVGCGDKVTKLQGGANNQCGENTKKVFTNWNGGAGWSPLHAGVSDSGKPDKDDILSYITENNLCVAYGFKEDASDAGSVQGDSPSQKCMAAWWGKFFNDKLPDKGDLATKLGTTKKRLALNSEEFAEVSTTSELGSFKFDSPSFTFLYGIATGVSIAAVISFYKFKQQHKGDEIAYEALLENEC